MITDFPEAKKRIEKMLNFILRQKVRQFSPMLSMFKKKILHEGNKIGVVYEDGRQVIDDLKYMQSEFSIEKKEATTIKADDLLNKLSAAAEDMAGQIERSMMQAIDESICESGNTISANAELGPDSILEALEAVTIDFEDDDRTKPIMPSLMAAPSTIQRLQEMDAKVTPEKMSEYRKKEEEIINQKYEEYINDLNSRRIIE